MHVNLPMPTTLHFCEIIPWNLQSSMSSQCTSSDHSVDGHVSSGKSIAAHAPFEGNKLLTYPIHTTAVAGSRLASNACFRLQCLELVSCRSQNCFASNLATGMQCSFAQEWAYLSLSMKRSSRQVLYIRGITPNQMVCVPCSRKSRPLLPYWVGASRNGRRHSILAVGFLLIVHSSFYLK